MHVYSDMTSEGIATGMEVFSDHPTATGYGTDTNAPPFVDRELMMKVGQLLDLALTLTLWLYVPILTLGIVGNGLSFHLLLKRAKTSSTYSYLATLSVMDSIFLIASIGNI